MWHYCCSVCEEQLNQATLSQWRELRGGAIVYLTNELNFLLPMFSVATFKMYILGLLSRMYLKMCFFTIIFIFCFLFKFVLCPTHYIPHC